MSSAYRGKETKEKGKEMAAVGEGKWAQGVGWAGFGPQHRLVFFFFSNFYFFPFYYFQNFNSLFQIQTHVFGLQLFKYQTSP
jgi:hypothetical protein